MLGSLLFLLYINDMKDACSCYIFLYQKVKLLESILTTELTNISKWLGDNKLSLHLGKTYYFLDPDLNCVVCLKSEWS